MRGGPQSNERATEIRRLDSIDRSRSPLWMREHRLGRRPRPAVRNSPGLLGVRRPAAPPPFRCKLPNPCGERPRILWARSSIAEQLTLNHVRASGALSLMMTER